MSTELTKTDAAVLAKADEVGAAVNSTLDKTDFALPLISLTQPLSKAVQDGNASPGELVNSVTGKNYGGSVLFVLGHQFKGRFWSTENDGVYVATGDIIPHTWPHPDAGKPFADCADAEEQYKEAVNNGDKEWGKGPAISTTFNYVGYILEQDPDELGNVPVRFSLMRTSAPTARAINTLVGLLRHPWDAALEIRAEKRSSNGRDYHRFAAAQARPTSDDEKVAAISLAQQLLAAEEIALAGDAGAEKAAKPVAKEGAMSVD